MSNTNKVIWSEGMFLRHEHFQQQDRYVENLISSNTALIAPYSWGVVELSFREELLRLGKLAIKQCRGLFADGTYFKSGDSASLQHIDVDKNTKDKLVYLGVPVSGVSYNQITQDAKNNNLARYCTADVSVVDNVAEQGKETLISVASLRLSLLVEGKDDIKNYVCIPIAKIIEVKNDGDIVLDHNFIPTASSCAVSTVLVDFLQELNALFLQKKLTLAARVPKSNINSITSMTEFLLLQLLNRYSDIIKYFSTQAKAVNPYDLFLQLLQMNSELRTFSSDKIDDDVKTDYLHHDLTNTFIPLINQLRVKLAVVVEQRATKIELVAKDNNLYTTADKELFSDMSYILAVKANIPASDIRNRITGQVKLGPNDQIENLINLQLSGVPLQSLPIIPAQIPYRAGYCYFELDQSDHMWKKVLASKALAIHVNGEFADMELELWAIKE